ncbi:MAG: anti-sigma factor antagonist [Gemmatimonadetes bacterium]|nr:MAG: anti-sigma factor antagonist [Gemmatimonadota bacterium]
MATDIQIVQEDVAGRSDSKIMHFSGSLDATNIQAVSDQIISLLNDSGVVNIIADFEQLKYLNSTALGNIIDYNKRVVQKGGKFILAAVNENVFEIFDIVGATSILNFQDTIDDAINSL